MAIKIVTDSACDVPARLAAELDITVIPVYINIGDASYRDGVDLSREAYYRKLAENDVRPTTAAPAVAAFTEVYERLSAEGATQILSIHLATGLSAIYNAARLGAEAADSAPVTLFDTGQITLGAGLLVILAAEAAQAGQSMDEIISMLTARVPRTRVFGMLDSLEALRHSGRVNLIQFGLGTLLKIKPVMMIHQGEISVVARIRTRSRSIKHALELLGDLKPFERLAVIHVCAPEEAVDLMKKATHLFPPHHDPLIAEIAPAVGTHLGLGALGFACIAQS